MAVDAETKPNADFEQWWNAGRTAAYALYAVIFPVIGVGLGVWAYRTGARYDCIYGEYFPFTLAFLSVALFLDLYLPFILANFRTRKPVRILREAILLLAILSVAFGLHYLAAYLFWGDGTAIQAVMRGFSGRMAIFLWIPVVSMGVVFFVWLEKKIRAARAKRGKQLQWKWFQRKVDGFLGRHPSLIVSSSKEFFFLSVRYTLWGVVLSVLTLEAMVVVWFMIHPPYRIDSFLGEEFGRKLSCDVERKKLLEPVGVIDEVMLQANGDPSRGLHRIYGCKYLGDVPDEEADRRAEEACAALQKLLKVELWNHAPCGRERFRKAFGSPYAYALVEWDDHFFQREKVLRIYVGENFESPCDSNLTVSEVMGYKIGMPIEGDGKPRTPFWKFERIVNQCGANDVVDGVYAVHDVSALSREEAIREFEEARRAVERLHGITMFKSVDYDDVKTYDYNGNDLNIGVKLEYRREKQIRYSVLAQGDWLEQIHAMPSVGGEGRQQVRDSNTAACLICIVVLCGGSLMLLIRRNGKDAS